MYRNWGFENLSKLVRQELSKKFKCFHLLKVTLHIKSDFFYVVIFKYINVHCRKEIQGCLPVSGSHSTHLK